jgi:hypothetical protein
LALVAFIGVAPFCVQVFGEAKQADFCHERSATMGVVRKVVSDAFRPLDGLAFGGRLRAYLDKLQAAQAEACSRAKGNFRSRVRGEPSQSRSPAPTSGKRRSWRKLLGRISIGRTG